MQERVLTDEEGGERTEAVELLWEEEREAEHGPAAKRREGESSQR